MSERSRKISKLISDSATRVSYTKASVGVNVASQIRALRRRRGMTQKALAEAAGMKQSRISAVETPGYQISVETLVRLAAAFEVGLQVKFVPYSEMLHWENEYSPDSFDVVSISEDNLFLQGDETWSDDVSAYPGVSCLAEPQGDDDAETSIAS